MGAMRESRVMLRKSVAILALFLSFLATEASALGLGRVAVESSLNQPLRVRIEVLQLGDTRLDDVNIQLASPEDFQRFNIERATFLNNIRFSTDATAEGNYVVLTTSQIVREPYLSFILETRWSNGRLLSEHTILLDLPVYQEQPVPQAAVRRPISAVVAPQSGGRTPESQPTLTAPATSAPSVQPIIEPEVIAPVDETATASSEEAGSVAIEPAADTTPALDLDDAAQSESVQPAPLAQNDEEQGSDASEAEPAEDEAEVENSDLAEEIAEEPAVETDAANPAEDVVDADEADEAEITEDGSVEEDPIESADTASNEEPAPETVTVGAADTLSDIALQVRPDNSVSIQQTMLALQELNPDAFTNGNINRLRRGEVLRVPSLNDIQAIGQREAITEVSRQNQQNTPAQVQPLSAPNQADEIEQEASGQLSVVTADPDADSVDGAGVSENSDDAELDQRIAELEDQLALREEEADRARIEKEELESRLAELDEQIAAAQEIIRLRDLQLAQLQQSLADAAAEAEQLAEEQAQAQAATPIEPAPAVTPAPQNEGFVASLIRALMSNTLILIGAVVAIIVLLVGVLVMRNRSNQSDEERLDTIDEDEFKGVTESKDVEVTDQDSEEEARLGSEFHDYEESELDSELDDIISVGGETIAEPVLDGEQNIGEQIDILIEHDQLDKAEALVGEAIAADPDDQELQMKRLEVTAAQGDLSAFELQAETLSVSADQEALTKIDALREGLAANARAAQPVEAEVTEIQTQREKDETASFLDDLGIDLDAFEDDAFELADDEPSADANQEAKPEEPLDDLPEESEPEAVDLMFDLAPPEDAEQSDDTEAESKNEIEAEIDSELSVEDEQPGEPDEVSIDDFTDTSADSELGGGDLEASAEVAAELADGDSKDPEDLEIDTLEFDIEAPIEDVSTTESEEELDLETFSFEPSEIASPELESAAEPDTEITEASDDENVLDFDFDKSEISAPEPEESGEIEAFDFDLEGDSADTVIEKSPATDSDDEIELELGDSSEANSGDNGSAAADDFDFDLSELEIDEGDDSDKNVEIELSDDDFLDLDEDVLETSDANDSSDGDIEFDFDEEITASESSNTEVETAAKNDDELDFLADEDVVFDTPDFEGDPESLSDEDETATKLELAYAYQKMGDADGAREILQEVIAEGSESQVKEAKDLISTIDSNPE